MTNFKLQVAKPFIDLATVELSYPSGPTFGSMDFEIKIEDIQIHKEDTHADYEFELRGDVWVNGEYLGTLFGQCSKGSDNSVDFNKSDDCGFYTENYNHKDFTLTYPVIVNSYGKLGALLVSNAEIPGLENN